MNAVPANCKRKCPLYGLCFQIPLQSSLYERKVTIHPDACYASKVNRSSDSSLLFLWT
jgi:hypothetical protein